MRNLNFGDIVKIDGTVGGREGTVIKPSTQNGVLVQVGPKSMYVDREALTLMSRSMSHRDGTPIPLEFIVGDHVRYTYPEPPENPEDEHPLRYGTITGLISEKRVMVDWVGDGEKPSRTGRLKWVPKIPEWFERYYG